jgi:aspartyl-tRNA(Asn)/glutamyl-tRNA(Gln) amidotransferase subunit A
MTDLFGLNAGELLNGYRARTFSPVEVVESIVRRIEGVEPVVNAFVTLTIDRALKEAHLAERAYRDGPTVAPLAGVPFAVKDLFDVAGVRTTYGSAVFRDHVPAQSATAVERMRAAGAILLGKTGTHEFGWGITSNNPHYGPTRNPWAPDRISGGSSGGSAVALAARETPLALGSDTGGSIRIPAAFCGVFGLKPTFGLISRAGAFPLAPTLDHAGVMARTPDDLAMMLEALAGVDPADPVTVRRNFRALDLRALDQIQGLLVGVCKDLHQVSPTPPIQSAFNTALAALEDAGAKLREVRFAGADDIYPAFGTTQRAEAFWSHRARGLFPQQAESYGADVLGRLELAATVRLDEYLNAQRTREAAHFALNELFLDVDVLVTPVSAVSPPPIGDEEVEHEGERRTLRDVVMPYTVPQDFTGVPACAVPVGFDELGIPVGIQLTGPPFSETRVLRCARVLFDAFPQSRALPDLNREAPGAH